MHGLKPDANNNLEKIDEFNIESSINRNIYVYDKYLIQDKSWIPTVRMSTDIFVDIMTIIIRN